MTLSSWAWVEQHRYPMNDYLVLTQLVSHE